MEDAGPGACIVRACTNSVVSPSITNCTNHLSTCVYNGT